MLQLLLEAVAVFFKRYGSVFFAILAVFLVIFFKADNSLIEVVRGGAAWVMRPVIAGVSWPIYGAFQLKDNIANMATLHTAAKSRDELSVRVSELESRLAVISKEKRQLESLLNYVPAPQKRRITAPIAVDSSSPFASSVILLAGSDDGISKGDIAVTGMGMLGRVVYAGSRSSRVILLTDASSRVPVHVGTNGYRAILAGNNTAAPTIISYPIKSEIKKGDTVVTSSVIDGLPAGLIVGVVGSVTERAITVDMAANLDGINFLQVISYDLRGLVPEDNCDAILRNIRPK